MITISSTAQKEPIPPLVKIREVAQLLSVSRGTVNALIESGDLEASEVNASKFKKRRHRRITRESLLEFYKKRSGHSLKRALANPFEPKS
jgi:excisionase family DNA binding protein